MTYNLFLDDVREVKDVSILLPPVEWVIVRNSIEFLTTLGEKGIPTRVSFDHDLGDESPSDGMDCLKVLVHTCHFLGHIFPHVYLHTMNPVAKEQMRSFIDSAYKSEYIV